MVRRRTNTGFNSRKYLISRKAQNFTKMKTILEWLEEAKQQGYDWADAAIRNYDPNFVTIKEMNSLIEALGNAFSWGSSPEKYEYWEKIQCGLAIQATPAAPESPSLVDLVARYEAARLGLDRVLPDKNLREPHSTASYAAYMASYQEDMKEVIEQISDTLGLTDKYYALQKEFEAYKVEAVKSITMHNCEVSELRETVSRLEERNLIGWVTADKDGQLWKWLNCIRKYDIRWRRMPIGSITPKEAMELCGRVPKWEDEEPTPIYEK